MLQIRKSNERGHANHGWLKSQHTFSFADYYDPKHMGFKSLRVINEDYIAVDSGFGFHPHRDMEIITYVVHGALEHKDSMGNTAIVKPGEVQRMSAGKGVVHSEYNSGTSEETHLFQIWILPNELGGQPGYDQKSFESELSSNKLVHVVSKDGSNGTISIKQDADMYISKLKTSEDLVFKIRPGRGVWIQVINGKLDINDSIIQKGDALSAINEETLKIQALENSEFILFDLI
ncbi:MAG: pirin family protein [Bacteriovoracaceae bacterium]